jgi:metal-dependent HD superfamily phosphatase/phosphodiesterase
LLTKELEGKLAELRMSVLPLLQYVPRSIGDYTDHGASHSEELDRLVQLVVQMCNSKNRKCNISPLEEYLLLCASWLHDIGNLRGREKHNETTCSLIKKLAGKHIWGIIDGTKEYLSWICFAHSREVKLDKVKETVELKGTIKLRYLSALFRLIDASDMASRRAPTCVFEAIADQLSNESKQYWKTHQAISDVCFREDSQEILVTVTRRNAAKTALDEYGKEFESVQKILSDYEFPCSKIRVVEIPKVPIEETLK